MASATPKATMIRRLLGRLLFPLMACSCTGLPGLGDGGPYCKPAHVSQSYDVAVTCLGGASYQGIVQLEGDVVSPVLYKNDQPYPVGSHSDLSTTIIAGHLEPFTFSAEAGCDGEGESTAPGSLSIYYDYNQNDKGDVTLVSQSGSDATSKPGGQDGSAAGAYSTSCDLSFSYSLGQARSCDDLAYSQQAACQVTLTAVP